MRRISELQNCERARWVILYTLFFIIETQIVWYLREMREFGALLLGFIERPSELAALLRLICAFGSCEALFSVGFQYSLFVYSWL